MDIYYLLAVIIFSIGLRIGTNYIYKKIDKKIGVIIIFISILVALIIILVGKWYNALVPYYEYPID